MSFLATNQESQPGFYTPTVPSFNGTPSSLCIGLHLRISHQCDDLDIICLVCHKFHGFHPAKSSTIEQTRPKQIRETRAKNERPRRNFRAMHLASTKPLSNKALCHQSLGMVNGGFLEAPWLGTTFVTSTVDCIQQKQCFRYHEFDQILTKWSNLIFLRHSRRPSVVGSHTNTRTRTIWQKFPYTHLSPACWYTWVCLSVTRLNQL